MAIDFNRFFCFSTDGVDVRRSPSAIGVFRGWVGGLGGVGARGSGCVPVLGYSYLWSSDFQGMIGTGSAGKVEDDGRH